MQCAICSVEPFADDSDTNTPNTMMTEDRFCSSAMTVFVYFEDESVDENHRDRKSREHKQDEPHQRARQTERLVFDI
jgi:hypothetical protein